MIRRLNSLYALLPLTVVLGACTTDSDESVDPVTDPTPGFVAVFNPEFGQMPFPNDLFFSGTTDGTLNIPAGSDPSLEALNALDGYSTYAPIYVETTDAINGESVQYGVSVFLVNAGTGVPAAADAHVAEYQNGSTVIEILPLAPLDPGTRYAVYVTKGVESTTDDNLAPSADFQALVDLYDSGVVPGTDLGDDSATALYGAVGPLIAGADLSGIGAENLAIAWSFQTQSIGASLGAIEAAAEAAAEPAATGFVPIPKNGVNYDAGIATTADLDARFSGHADVYVGAIELPYYSSVEAPLSGYWTPEAAPCQAVVDAVDVLTTLPPSTTAACPMPAVKGTVAVPVLLTVPNASSGSGGAIAGVTIFQHGITGDRSNMLAAADALADVGQAVLAIDLPLHGLAPGHALYANDSALYAATGIEGVMEATFDLDVVDNETGAAGADGVADTSGKHFINLASLLTSRDNLRQGVANLIHLVKAVPTMDYNAALDPTLVGPDFAPLPISFVGQSLGAMTGVPFLAVNADAGRALLSVPGGGVAALLTQSPTFGPVIAAGLQQNGIVEGSRQFAEFMRNAQTAVDAGDPINYGADVLDGHNEIVVHEVIGGFAAGDLEDQVIPNFATDALVDAMGLDQLGSGVHVAPVSGVVKFNQGGHSSLLDPSASMETTVEMQTQMASFIGSGNLAVGTAHSEVIDEP